MAIFDEAGAVNAPDAGGAGAPPIPPAQSLPSVASPPQTPPPPQEQDDPRYAAALAALQPKQVPAWQQALRSIAPILGTLLASRQNAGGAFMNAWQQGEQRSQQLQDEESQRQLNIATILHQQQQERAQARKEATAAKAIELKAQKEQAAKQDKILRDEWTAQSQGGLIDTINDLITTHGPEAADQYMKSTHLGSLTEQGLPHTVKDLVDRYAVKGPDGTLIGGKAKTQKEVKAGTQEDWVSTAESIEEKKRGRPLTDEERKAVDGAAIAEYKNLARDPDAAELTKATRRMQLTLEGLRADQLRQQMKEQADAKGEIREGTKEFGVARDLAYGILPYSDFARMYAYQRNGREQMRTIYAKARDLNPEFSPALFEQGAKFAGSPQTRRSLGAVANVEAGIPSMIDASNAAARSHVKFLNEHFIIPGGAQIGEHEYSDLQAAHKAFGDELSLALGVGTASDLKTKLGLEIADPNLDPSAFESVLKRQVLPFLERRKQSLRGQMGPYGVDKASDMLPKDGATDTAPKPVPGLPGVTFVVR